MSEQGISSEIKGIADKLKPEIEKQLKLKFNEWNVLYFERYPTDVQHTSYYIKVATDNNGHVRFRAFETEDKGDWKFEVDEYDKGNVPIDPNEYIRGKESSQQSQSEGLKSQGQGLSTGMTSQQGNA